MIAMFRPMASPASLVSSGNHFDVLRLLLAVVVIFSHSFLAADGHLAHEWVHRWTSGNYTLGGLAVAAFIALSGFLVAESWHRSRSGWDFLRRRVCRIFPAYIVCYVVSTAVALLLASGQFKRDSVVMSLAEVGVRAVLLSPGFPVTGAFPDNPLPGAINISLWTICVEFVLYFLLAGVAALRLLPASPSLARVVPLLTLFAGTLLFRALVLPTGQYHDHGLSRLFVYPPSWTGLAPYFVAGMVAWSLRFHLPRSWALFGASVALPALLVRWPVWFDLSLPICIMYGLMFVGFAPGRGVRLPRWMGDLSYGTYLYGWVVQQLVVMYLPGEWVNPYSVALVSTPLALGVALASWHGVERHFLQGRARYDRPAKAVVAAAVAAGEHVGVSGRPRVVSPNVKVTPDSALGPSVSGQISDT